MQISSRKKAFLHAVKLAYEKKQYYPRQAESIIRRHIRHVNGEPTSDSDDEGSEEESELSNCSDFSVYSEQIELEDYNLKQLFGDCSYESENSNGDTCGSSQTRDTFKALKDNSSKSDNFDASESSENKENIVGILEDNSEDCEADISGSTESSDADGESQNYCSCSSDEEDTDVTGFDYDEELQESDCTKTVINKGYCRLLENIFCEEFSETLFDKDWEIDFSETCEVNDAQDQETDKGHPGDNEESFGQDWSVEDQQILLDEYSSTRAKVKIELEKQNLKLKQMLESIEACQDALDNVKRENDEVHKFELEMEQEVLELEASVAKMDAEEFQANERESKDVDGPNVYVEEDAHVDR